VAAKQRQDDNRARTWIAFVVIGLGVVGIIIISGVAMALATDKDETSRLVFASVLPLLGTWVGAVLAFYFSRENLQAASETTLEAVRAFGGVDSETLVAAVMTPVNKINPRHEVTDDAAARGLPLVDIYSRMRSTGQSRVPVLTEKQGALYVVHEPDIDKYAQAQGVAAVALPATETLGKLLQDAAIGPEVSGFVTVSPTATLGQVRGELNKNLHAKDVFVTDNGQRAGSVLGWLTNSDLARAV
jgi:CBS domain-containing protein